MRSNPGLPLVNGGVRVPWTPAATATHNVRLRASTRAYTDHDLLRLPTQAIDYFEDCRYFYTTPYIVRILTIIRFKPRLDVLTGST
ncbi:hypothetical protein EVAR_54246_1 [Eumeta japonica]|uniref:Uncharacterized protein n=1 Tax=Eumeta variegata TaxID=151549 RepID=A0A4C1YIX9_EUMVA|nr:hypothetical protein EVAR_54246_1 [Eumeta japonica]